MSEQTQAVVATPAAPIAITAEQGAAMLKAQRAAANTPTPPNPSDAARILGQRAAEARREKQAQAALQPQETSGEVVQQVEDEPSLLSGEPRDESVTTETPEVIEAEPQDDPDAGMIELEDGVKMTKAEIRESILLKADHTRRLQSLAVDRKALAEKVKSVEARESQGLQRLEQVVSALEQRLQGQTKSLKQYISEDPDNALQLFADQQERLEQFHAAREVFKRQESEHIASLISQRDEALAESYNPEWADESKRNDAYTKLSEYALKLGADPNHLRRLTSPWMIQVLDKAAKYDAAEAGRAKVQTVVAGKPTVVKPGVKVSAQSSAANAISRTQAAHKQQGTIASAVAALRAQRAANRRG